MNIQSLNQKKCQPCEGKEKPFCSAEGKKYIAAVEGWKLKDACGGIYRKFTMKDFLAAIEFINQVAEVAEREGHHPDIHLTHYKHLRIDLTTHAIGGLSDNDFIVAAKISDIQKKDE